MYSFDIFLSCCFEIYCIFIFLLWSIVLMHVFVLIVLFLILTTFLLLQTIVLMHVFFLIMFFFKFFLHFRYSCYYCFRSVINDCWFNTFIFSRCFHLTTFLLSLSMHLSSFFKIFPHAFLLSLSISFTICISLINCFYIFAYRCLFFFFLYLQIK